MRRISLVRYGAALLALQGSVCAVASAQCRPAKNSNEAKLLAFYDMPIVFSADPTTVGPDGGPFRLTVEGVYVPTAPASIQRTQTCYTGHVQNTSLTALFGRPRLAVTLPGGFGAEVSYLPPIKVADATPNLFSAAAWLTRSVTSDIHMTARLHLTHGTVHGPITCPRSGLQQTDPAEPCYGNDISDDEFRPDMFGGEVIASLTPNAGASRVSAHAGVGVNLLRPQFTVDFTSVNGSRDRTHIIVDLTRVSGFLGAAVRVTQRCQAATQGYASFGDGATIRAYLGCDLFSRHVTSPLN